MTESPETITLFRPVGQGELELIEASGWTAFPPRLEHQPFFYPVANEAYAAQIARDWNTKDAASGFVGYVTRFHVRGDYLARHPLQMAGARMHQEYWIPADEMDDFNRGIVGRIEVVAEFRPEARGVTPEALRRAARVIAGAGNVLVSSGAGMSKESGIPTFRDAMEGLWANFDPQSLATEAGFRQDPRRVWSWYAWRRARVGDARPNPGHRAVAELESLVPELTVVTQNVDGLHTEAGSTDVVELHGNIRRVKCLENGHAYHGPLPPYTKDEEQDPPPCPVCGSPLRPDVVWFGEMLPADAVERAWNLAERCDVLLLIGTSGTVWPAAELPLVARRHGGLIVEVNPEPSELTHAADIFLQGPAGTVLPALVDAVRTAKSA